MEKVELILIFAVVFLMIFSSGISAGTYSGGTGEPNDPYLIATAADLNDIGNYPEDFNKCFLMVADVNLAEYSSNQFNIIGADFGTPFTGVFDGNDHKISNFTYECNGVGHIGLFGHISAPNAEVKNITLVEPYVDVGDSNYIGALVGWLENGIITGCSLQGGNVSGYDYVGGLAGCNHRGTISYCYPTCSVSGYRYVGGLVGANCSLTTYCYAKSNVTGHRYIGGLAGENWFGTIIHCRAASNVAGDYNVGGLSGYHYRGFISLCYATGSASGTIGVGGLVGLNAYCKISRCYSTVSVSSETNVGGLVGVNWADITESYAVGPVNGQSGTGGLVGYSHTGSITGCFWDIESTGQSHSQGGEGKTTAEMKTEKTFKDAGWDFIEVWDIGENQTYPFLRTHPAGDIDHDDIVNFYDFVILADHWLQGTQ